MKNINTKLFAFTLFAALCVLLASCYQPSPIYGAWSDNSGNKISFADDGSFSATIVDPDDPSTKINYSGAYTVIENVISFSKDDGSIVTEWDIRGGMLYLTWFDSYGQAINLTLYHN